MSAFILTQIPYPDIASTVTANQLPLIRMDHHVIHGVAVVVVALNTGGSCIPDLHRAILRACHHPFPLTVEADPRNVAIVSLERKHRIWVSRLDIEQLDQVSSRCGEEPLVWGYA